MRDEEDKVDAILSGRSDSIHRYDTSQTTADSSDAVSASSSSHNSLPIPSSRSISTPVSFHTLVLSVHRSYDNYVSDYLHVGIPFLASLSHLTSLTVEFIEETSSYERGDKDYYPLKPFTDEENNYLIELPKLIRNYIIYRLMTVDD